ncbi:ribonuclease P protein component [Capnocytophaga canis]|uniref:ribonuclease P protein component n=1 Tax=Capnocytophaga canis TaxID=1848903 RepID=UPI0021752D0F|nr:ribonuclease P protein component [Capnocytophaga canis]
MIFCFSKEEKLCKLEHIQKLFSEGKSVQSFPLKFLYIPIEKRRENTQFQLLISVPKRNFKKAVDRNRIKRLIRESYRLQKHQLATFTNEKYALAFIFTSKDMPTYDLIFNKVNRCFEKFAQVLETQTKDCTLEK